MVTSLLWVQQVWHIALWLHLVCTFSWPFPYNSHSIFKYRKASSFFVFIKWRRDVGTCSTLPLFINIFSFIIFVNFLWNSYWGSAGAFHICVPLSSHNLLWKKLKIMAIILFATKHLSTLQNHLSSFCAHLSNVWLSGYVVATAAIYSGLFGFGHYSLLSALSHDPQLQSTLHG